MPDKTMPKAKIAEVINGYKGKGTLVILEGVAKPLYINNPNWLPFDSTEVEYTTDAATGYHKLVPKVMTQMDVFGAKAKVLADAKVAVTMSF